MAISRGPKIITNGLALIIDAADRNSYPGSGTAWKDVGGTSKVVADTSLVTYGDSTFICSALNQYIWFGGTAASLQNLTDSGNSHSFEVWFSPLGAVPGASDGYVLGRKGFHSGFRQLKGDGTGKSIGSSIVWYYDFSNTVVGNAISTELNTWAHMVLVINQQNNFAYAYHNGVQNGSSVALTKAIVSYGTADYFMLSGSGTDYSTNGKIAIARLYNRALTASEVSQNFNAMRKRFGV
jgi:hypothetical protein